MPTATSSVNSCTNAAGTPPWVRHKRCLLESAVIYYRTQRSLSSRGAADMREDSTSSLTLAYSLDAADGAGQVVVRVGLDGQEPASDVPIATLSGLATTAGWNEVKTTSVTFDVPAAGEHSLRLRLSPGSYGWGFQVDRILVEAIGTFGLEKKATPR